MDWTAAFEFQREHVGTHINRLLNSDVAKVGQDEELAIDQIFSLKIII